MKLSYLSFIYAVYLVFSGCGENSSWLNDHIPETKHSDKKIESVSNNGKPSKKKDLPNDGNSIHSDTRFEDSRMNSNNLDSESSDDKDENSNNNNSSDDFVLNVNSTSFFLSDGLQEAKKYFTSLQKFDKNNAARISIASQNIEENNSWLTYFGIDINDKSSGLILIVNAVNKNYDLGGSGINGAIKGWMVDYQKLKIRNRQFLNGDSKMNGKSKVFELSKFRMSDTNFWQISGCGPDFSEDVGKGKEVKTLQDAFNGLLSMYKGIFAHGRDTPNVKKIIFPAFSSAIFASSGVEEDGKKFTKTQAQALSFIAAHIALKEHESVYASDDLQVIANNFGEVHMISL